MTDLISREKLKDDIAVLLERNSKLIDEWLANCIDDIIDEAPTIEAVPKHGLWIKDDIKLGDDYAAVLVCSECDKINWGMVKLNYCPNCGARMDEVENGK